MKIVDMKDNIGRINNTYYHDPEYIRKQREAVEESDPLKQGLKLNREAKCK